MNIASHLLTWRVNDKYLLFHELINRAFRLNIADYLEVGFFCIVDDEEWE